MNGVGAMLIAIGYVGVAAGFTWAAATMEGGDPAAALVVGGLFTIGGGGAIGWVWDSLHGR